MSKSLEVGFAGTPEFARVALEHLIESGYRVRLVLTQPDRPAGRGMKLTASPVKQFSLEHRIPVYQPESLRPGKYLTADAQDPQLANPADEALNAILQAVDGKPLDVLIVAAYGLILPQVVLDAPRLGCLNIHASLLPRWRGAAPIHRAIEAGDTETGVCIMQMEAGLDTGPVRLQRNLAISDKDTTSTLHDRLAKLGGECIVEALDALRFGKLPLVPQPEAGVTYAQKIEKAEGVINWSQSALTLQRKLRAFDPFPGCVAQISGQAVKCFVPELVDVAQQGRVGEILALTDSGLIVQCGQGQLQIGELQRPGSKRGLARVQAEALGLRQGDVFEIPNELAG